MRLAFVGWLWLGMFGASSAWAQGGFGGGGGGFGGAQQGPLVGDDEVASRSLFLSPGDKTEWNFEAKEHEGIQIEITSFVFDPAVAIVDEQGKKLAENDDIEPGNQMARVVFALPKAGKYRAVVTNYKGSAGGAFSFKSTRFRVLDAPVGVLTSLILDDKPVRARLVVDKPGDYVIAQHGANGGFARIVNSRGVSEDSKVRSTGGGPDSMRWIFAASEPGVYFVQFASAEKPAIRWLPVTIRAAAPGQVVACDLGPDEVVHWTIPGKRWDILQVALASDSTEGRFTVNPLPSSDPDRPTYVRFNGADGANRSVVEFLADSQAVIETSEREGKPMKAVLKPMRVGRPLPAPGRQDSKLGWGDVDIWTLRAKPGDVVRITCVSTTYRTSVVGLDADGGGVYWFASSGAPPVATTTLAINSDGQYAFAVTGGGVGAYRLDVSVTPPRTLGAETAHGELKADAPDVWRFHAAADEDVLFKIDGAEGLSSTLVIGPDGKDAGAAQLRDPKHGYLLRVVTKAAGDYTLKISAPNGGGYTIERIPLGG